MIDEPTLFILGAGASKPYGFPLGAELRSQIISDFLSDYEQLLATSTMTKINGERELRDVKNFITHFKGAPTYSIDDYLAYNPIFSYYGKIAIALYIRKKEIESKFIEDMDPKDAKEDWYRYLFYRMLPIKKM